MSKLIPWEPFKELADIQNRLSSLFSRNREHDALGESTLLPDVDWAPAVDVSEDDREYLLTADLPDVEKDQVKVTVDNGALQITGERHHEKEEKDKKKKFHRIERSFGRYQRTFRVPDDVASDLIKAKFKNGVLKVHLPKSAGKKPSAQEVTIS